MKNVEVEKEAAMSIKNGIIGEGKEIKKDNKNKETEETNGMILVEEGLRMEGVKPKSGKTAVLEIELGEENSKVRWEGQKHAHSMSERQKMCSLERYTLRWSM